MNDETLKALIEAIIYVAPEPVTLEAMVKSLEGEERDRVKVKLQELMADFERPGHGIHIRHIAGGYKFYSKPEHHEVLRKFVKSLKPPLRLSKPALETLAVIAYRQPATQPEIEEIRGVDCSGVIHTLLEKKLVVTAGRKNAVGRPILYRTSRDFLVHFGLSDLSELPSQREFEELARQAVGPDAVSSEAASAGAGSVSSGNLTTSALPETASSAPAEGPVESDAEPHPPADASA